MLALRRICALPNPAVSCPVRSASVGPFMRVKIEGCNKRGKAVAKKDLPTKLCKTCGRPFTWRKKWEKVWEEVKYCSNRCRNHRGSSTGQQDMAEEPD